MAGDSFLGASSRNNVYLVGQIQTDLIPGITNTYNLGSIGASWQNLWLSGNATIAGTLTVGAVTISSISNNLVPTLTATYDLGSPILQWNNLYLAGTANLNGNVIIGTTSANTLTVNARFTHSGARHR